MTTNHEHLREVAEKATPGPWQWHPGSDNVVAWNVEDIDICAVYQDAEDTKTTGEFIATFNPATAIALLDELAALRKENEGLRAAAEFASNVCAEIYAKYQLKIGPFVSQAQVANVKLRAAIGDSHE